MAPTAEPRERLLFRIGDQRVELVGRLADLSADEEQRLRDALERLLADHGLALGLATINGRPLAARFTRMI